MTNTIGRSRVNAFHSATPTPYGLSEFHKWKKVHTIKWFQDQTGGNPPHYHFLKGAPDYCPVAYLWWKKQNKKPKKERKKAETLNCEICGSEFSRINHTQRSCFGDCAEEFLKRSYARNLETQKRKTASKLEQKKLTFKCAHCGSSKIPDGFCSQTKYCSFKCKQNAFYATPEAVAKQRLRNQLKKNNIQWRLAHRFRNYTKASLCKVRFGNSVISLLGCSVPFFRQWLENRFLPGMTWENYGSEWHVDHIIPIAEFDLTKKKDAHQCFNFSNMRPLWKADNLAKGRKILRQTSLPL